MPRYARRSIRKRSRYTKRKSYSKKKGYRPKKTRTLTVTDGRDRVSQYRKRSMPRGKKRAWVSFTKKVHAVENSRLGVQTIIFNDVQTFALLTSILVGPTLGYRPQAVIEHNLYSLNANINGGNDQDGILNELRNSREVYDQVNNVYEPRINLTGERLKNSVTMSSARLEISYTNTSIYSVEMDFYTLSHYGTKLPFVSTTQITSLAVAQRAYADLMTGSDVHDYPTVASTKAPVFLEKQGVTPFQCHGLNKITGSKIINKEKVFVKPGETVLKTYVDNRHHRLKAHEDTHGSRYSKETTTYLCIANLLATLPETESAQILVKYTKTYSWHVPGVTTPMHTYFSSNAFENVNA